MFLIDGYNLLHALARGKGGEGAREALIRLIDAWCVGGNHRARIVFDPTGGMKRNEQRGGLEIRNVPQGASADDEILAALGSTEDRTHYRVVSNDLSIVRAAEKRGFSVVSCEEFARMIAPRPATPEKKDSASPGEVDYWMKEFGLEEDP